MKSLMLILVTPVLPLILFSLASLGGCQLVLPIESQPELINQEQVIIKEKGQRDGGKESLAEEPFDSTRCCESYHLWALKLPKMTVWSFTTHKDKLFLSAEVADASNIQVGSFAKSWKDHAGLILEFSSSGQILSAMEATGKAPFGFGIAFRGLTLDPNRNKLYVVGETRGVDVQFGPTLARAKARGFYKDPDVLIGSISLSAKKYEWGLCAGGAYSKDRSDGRVSSDIAYDAIVGEDGSLYVSGVYQEPSVFGSISLVGRGAFLAKLNPKGHFLWVKTMPAHTFETSLVKVPQGGVLQLALFHREMKVGTHHYSGPSDLIALVEWDPQGIVRSVQVIQALTKESRLTVPTMTRHRNGSLTIMGTFQGKAKFGSHTLQSSEPSLYVARLHSKGKFLSVHRTLSLKTVSPTVSMAATENNVYVAIQKDRLADNKPNHCKLQQKQTKSGLLLLKMNTQGQCIWVRQANVMEGKTHLSVSSDEKFLYLIGNFERGIWLGGEFLQTQNDEQYGTFLWKMSTVP